MFSKIEADFRHFLSRFQSIEPYFIPLSALEGDNVVSISKAMPWFQGVSLIEHLETVPVGRREENSPFRFPVQRVVRPDLDFRGYAGQIVSGVVRPGDSLTVVPSGHSARVKSIVTFDGELAEAHAPQSVTLTLDEEIDIVRGDVLSAEDSKPTVARAFDATVVWLNEQPLDPKKRYRLKHTSQQQWAEVKLIHHRVNINTLDHENVDTLEMNAIGVIRIETARPIYFDSYRQNRGTGSFILIDPVTNATVAAGMISTVGHDHLRGRARLHDSPAKGPVTISERVARYGHTSALLRLGNRRHLATKLERKLFDHGSTVLLLERWNDDWAAAFQNAAILILIVSETSRRENDDTFEIRTPSGEIKNRLSPLPEDDDEAAEAIYRLLERTQILFPAQSWTESAGI